MIINAYKAATKVPTYYTKLLNTGTFTIFGTSLAVLRNNTQFVLKFEIPIANARFRS